MVLGVKFLLKLNNLLLRMKKLEPLISTQTLL